MDPYTPKAFAIGEVLTAQDVNEHLVNRIRRTILSGSEVIDLTAGSTATGTAAIVDEDADGNKMVTLTVIVSGHGGPALPANIGYVVEQLRPPTRIGLTFAAVNQSGYATLESSGLIVLRDMPGGVGSGTFLRFSGCYPILAD